MSSSYTRTSLRIPSKTDGWNLDTWRYDPVEKGPEPLPVIVMAHGLSANKMMGLDPYASAFASIGFVVLVFDYRRWGSSDGTPRHIVNVPEQLEDYRTVIRYARHQGDIDGQRLVLWGSSFAGGHVVTLAAESDINPVGVISQCPFMGGLPEDSSFSTTISTLKNVVYAVVDVVKQSLGFAPLYIPAAALPGNAGALTLPGSLEGLGGLAPEESKWPNELSASSLFGLMTYRPVDTASQINCYLLVVVCGKDNLCSPTLASIAAGQGENGEALVLSDAGHFDIYPGMPFFKQSFDRQIEFLKRILDPQSFRQV